MLSSKEATKIMIDSRNGSKMQMRLAYESGHSLLLEEVNNQVLTAASAGFYGTTLRNITLSKPEDWDDLAEYLRKCMGYTTSWYCYSERVGLRIEWDNKEDRLAI